MRAKRDKLQLTGSSGLRACFAVSKVHGENQQDAAEGAQDLEAACEAALLAKPQPQQRATDSDGNDAMEAAFDDLFAGGVGGEDTDGELSDETGSAESEGGVDRWRRERRRRVATHERPLHSSGQQAALGWGVCWPCDFMAGFGQLPLRHPRPHELQDTRFDDMADRRRST